MTRNGKEHLCCAVQWQGNDYKREAVDWRGAVMLRFATERLSIEKKCEGKEPITDALEKTGEDMR